MTDGMMWIARRDGGGWNSNRTRDEVDLAFTVDKEDGGFSRVTIRRPKNSSDPKSRAVDVIGVVYYNSDVESKKKVEEILQHMNTCVPEWSDIDGARTHLLKMMLTLSAHHPSSGAIIEGSWTSQDALLFGSDPEDEEVEDDTVSKLLHVDPTTSAEAWAAWSSYAEAIPDAHDLATPTEEPTHIGELAAEVMETAIANSAEFVPYEPVSEHVGMVEAIEEIQAVVEPAFDPETWEDGEPYPANYMKLGNRLIKMEWPK